MSRFIQIVEVGPRDGLQNEKTVLEPAVRAAFIQRLDAGGARRIEAVSLMYPKCVPQMAGAEEVMAALPRTEGRPAIVEARDDEACRRALADLGAAGRAVGVVSGHNYSSGDDVRLPVYAPAGSSQRSANQGSPRR